MDITFDTELLHKAHTRRIPSRLLYGVMLGISSNGEVHIYYDDIEYITGLSQQTIIDSIKDLINGKLIERIARGRYIIL
jgi:predicted transcriptional regulator